MTQFRMSEPSRPFGKNKPPSAYCSSCNSSSVLKIFGGHRLREVKCYSCGETEKFNAENV